MIEISHRGNLTGPNENLENNPEYIDLALNKGYDCEVDIRIVNNQIYLGHDDPQYIIDYWWLQKRKKHLWIHCKDLDTLSYFNSETQLSMLNYFFHESDLGVLTSCHYIWSTNNVNNGILVMPEVYNTKPNAETLGICSDFIIKPES
tara:strand:+ start:2943 stop:3383 length:441 start_codon:yes stop_codon:yes gene_type:complete